MLANNWSVSATVHNTGKIMFIHRNVVPNKTLIACLAQVSGPQRDIHSGNDGGVFCEPMMDLIKVGAWAAWGVKGPVTRQKEPTWDTGVLQWLNCIDLGCKRLPAALDLRYLLKGSSTSA